MTVSPALLAVSQAADTRVDIDTARTFPDAEIPFLKAAGLDRVPGYRTFPGTDAEDPAWRIDFKDYAHAVIEYREWLVPRCEKSPREAANQVRLATIDPNYFKAMFCSVQEPRDPTRRTGSVRPMVPYHFQVHLTNAWLERIRAPFSFDDPDQPILDMWVPKSRGPGMTKNNMADNAWLLLSLPDARSLLLARDQDTVYKRDDDGALMSIIIFVLDHLPPFLIKALARGYLQGDPSSRWYKKNLIVNRMNGAQIKGSAKVVSAGRGDRFLAAEIDEAGEHDHLEEVLSSIRYAVKFFRLQGTEKAKQRDFLDSWQAAKRIFPSNVFEVNWHQCPWMNEAYVAYELARATTPEAQMKFRREVLRDPWAETDTWIYPEARDLPDADHPYTPALPLDRTFDPAGTGDDVAFKVVQLHRIDGQDVIHTLFTYQRKLPNPEWMAHLCTGIWPEPGDDCWGQIATPDERTIGEFFHERWLRGELLRDFMDPAGDQHSTHTSYKKMLEKKTRELRQRAFARLDVERQRDLAMGIPEAELLPLPKPTAISPKCDILKKHRTFADRQFAVRKYLAHMTFQMPGYLGLSASCSASWGRTCLGEHAYRDSTPGQVSEPKPKHGQFSHVASCYEHYCLYCIYRFTDPPKPREDAGVHLPGPGLRPIPKRDRQRVAPGRSHRQLPDRAHGPRWR